MKKPGAPQQHGHLPRGECLDAFQCKEHFQVMMVKGRVKCHQLVYQEFHDV